MKKRRKGDMKIDGEETWWMKCDCGAVCIVKESYVDGLKDCGCGIATEKEGG